MYGFVVVYFDGVGEVCEFFIGEVVVVYFGLVVE